MITFNKISKKFGKIRVLNEITTTCGKGECIALIGPNGCGKTTLIKSILGMVLADSGTITFDGKNIAGDWEYRNKIGYMPQIGRYPDNMTIVQILNMMRDIRNSKALDEDLILGFSINKLLDKRMRTLSGGTIQKVSAALAFLFDPAVLILDEPTAGLDPVASELFKKKVLAEKEKGKLILITSHILSDLDDLVSRVIYMQDGNLIFHKSVTELQRDTGEERLARSIAQVMSMNYE
ncbi:ABC transporter ATP-binding protein [Daejeonella sp.]|uniref:ABC transporter ATP-binding protein n=1 Tax=Daejeonella sp. TaxID=2805397 RepID=UPI0039830FF4